MNPENNFEPPKNFSKDHYENFSMPGQRMQNSPEPVQKKENFFWEIIKFAIIAAAIVLPIRFFVAQPFIVNGQSMEPTFSTNQYLIVDELSYRFSEPKRGDVLIFKYPYDTSKYFIKRIIGLPGEEVVINDTETKIINKDHPNGFVLNEPYVVNKREGVDDVKLGPDEYFVMGDNRPDSSDSRSWGPLNKSYIIGRPFVRLLPLDKISFFPGEYEFNK